MQEYVWFNGMPVAVVDGATDEVFFIRTDHIGRPIFATDDVGVKVWEASYLPFGGVHLSTGAVINLRFPGQWFHMESGLHQNWMRDYDPTTGRYMQADPLGLVDGASVYGYALQNPGRYVDPTGEFVPVIILGVRVGIAGYGAYRRAVAARTAVKVGTAALLGGAGSGPSSGPNGVPLPEPEDECDDECTPANAKFWNSLANYRGGIRRSGSGRRTQYYVWDYAHYCEVEVYDRRGRHLGAINGDTGAPIPSKNKPKPGRKIDL